MALPMPLAAIGLPVPESPVFPALRHATVPNLITSLSGVLGVSGLMLVVHGHLAAALGCILLAIPCDILDGWAARKLGQASSFGAELDSLADATSFCVLPAVVAASVGPGGPLGHVAAVAFALAGLWRLAYFKEAGLVTLKGRPAFVGMPTPYAAAVLLVLTVAVRTWPTTLPGPTLTIACGLLAAWMVHRAPFPKGGWAYRLMWLLLPVAAALTVWH